MTVPIAEAVKRAEEWIVKYTKLDPKRSSAAVLGFVVWIEKKGIDIDTLRVASAAKDKWNLNKQRIRKPRHKGESYMRPATSGELRAYCIGRSQRRGVSPRFWYAVPPDDKPVDEPVPKTVGEWLGRE